MQHLDEGTIHAWLDGALPPDEAAAATAHVQACRECAQAVAEARGLVAASSRILTALDDVPAVQGSAPARAVVAQRSGWWWRRAGIGYAAAATVLLAAGTMLILRDDASDALLRSDTAAVAPLANEPLARTDSAQPAPVAERPATPPAAKDAPVARQAARDEAQPTRPLADARGAAATEATREVRAAEKTADTTRKEADLSVDRVVPLPGAMPRVTGAQAPGRRDLSPEAIVESAAGIVGCHEIRPAVSQARQFTAAYTPQRVQLEAVARARAQREEALQNRARTLEGAAAAQSWRLVGDSLEIVWTHDDRTYSMRFARANGEWRSANAVLVPCAPR